MANAQIIVDSAADLDTETVQALDIHVVPWTVHLDGEAIPDSPDLHTPEFYRRAFRPRTTFSVSPPTVRQYAEVLERCTRVSSQMILILSSDTITRASQIARRSRTDFMGRCDVHLVDSRFISCIQGEIAAEAARAAQTGLEAVEIIRQINAMIARSYLAFGVDSPDNLVRHSLVVNTPAVLGTPAGYRPLLLLEEGQIAPLARSRRRGEPVERMVEFVGEFPRLRRLWTVSTGLNPGREQLHALMQELLPDRAYTDHIYGPVVASYFGPTLLGVAAIESA
jgi:DegV family protein with EDD domain